MSETTFNPARRRLCPDGACIGVIGDDGRCRVCGRAPNGLDADSVAGLAGIATFSSHDGSDHGSDDGVDDDSIREARDGASDEGSDEPGDQPARLAGADHESGSLGAFRPDRRLCDDGSCVGVIGAGEVCSVCGRPAGG